MTDYEKLGVFYLGKEYDLAAGARKDDLVLYDSKDLVTHAVCVGMTGSGKTGLCLGLLEEAAIDGVPAIVIDPKGDLGNLLLTFPNLSADEFAPWINPDDARRKGITPEAFAAEQAALWERGLREWDQDAGRIARLRASADFAIYTPGSSAGLPLSILSGFSAPDAALRADRDLYRERIATCATSLLGLAGVQGDPIRSREHILLSALIDAAWQADKAIDLGALIHEVQNPPMTRIGVMEIETFFPSADRFDLAMRLNALVASPAFASWMEGDPLDPGALLYTAEGKPRISVISIAHLSDAERMFFVSLLLEQILAWTRRQSGTTSLRAIVYMDEIAGYCPPVAAVPSKAPLLTLMKQGRAFGVGVVLATQNPVDLDYKGLSNAGTWFIGRLQTDRDKQRLLDGLEGAASNEGGRFDRGEMDRLLSSLRSRVFLMNNVHDERPTIFETRWVMSYLRGPLTRDQIRTLMAPRRTLAQAAVSPVAPPPPPPLPASEPESRAAPTTTAPVVSSSITQVFLPHRPGPGPVRYTPAILGSALVHFADRSLDVEHEIRVVRMARFTDGPMALDFERSEELDIDEDALATDPAIGAEFAPLAAEAGKSTSYTAWKRDLADLLFRTARVELQRSEALGETSRIGESEREFRARLVQTTRERRDEAIEKLRARYAPKLATLEERLRKAEQAVEVQKAQARSAKVGSAISFGTAILSAILGKKKVSSGNVTRAGSAARSATRAAREASDVERAEDNAEAIAARLAALREEVDAEVAEISAAVDPTREPLETIVVRPKKSHIKVRVIALAWVPE